MQRGIKEALAKWLNSTGPLLACVYVDGVLSGALACWFQAMVIPERVNMCVCE